VAIGPVAIEYQAAMLRDEIENSSDWTAVGIARVLTEAQARARMAKGRSDTAAARLAVTASAHAGEAAFQNRRGADARASGAGWPVSVLAGCEGQLGIRGRVVRTAL